MSKQKRELLIFFAILVVLGGLLIIRLGGGGEESGIPAAGPPSTVGGAVQPGGPPATGGPHSVGVSPGNLTVDQVPIEILNPALSDSAVAARIARSLIVNPFAENRGISTQRGPIRPTQPATRPRDPTLREVKLDEWPEGLRLQSISEYSEAPGTYRARINGHIVSVGEKIPGTDWELREVMRNSIVLFREVKTSSEWIQYHFTYTIPPQRNGLR